MKPKTLFLLAVAAGCGLIAMLGVQQAMQSKPVAVKVQTTKVLVALDNIDTGMKLTSDNTAFKEMATASIPEDAVRKEEEFQDRAAKVHFMAGDVIRKTKLTEQGEWGKSVAIPAGMRVIGIPVDDSHTISGLIRPGDRVDVLVTYQGRGERGSPVSKTKTLLEYVEVFGMDDQTASKMDDKSKGIHARIASLIVTPEQAGYVILAQRKGSLSLSWRRRSDDELAQTKDVDEKLMEELEGTVGIHDGDGSFYERGRSHEEEPQIAEAQTPAQFLNETAEPATVAQMPAKPMWTVEIYNGNESVPQQFELPPEKTLPENFNSPEEVKQNLLRLDRALQLN
ncbi:Flp pilus assembly protein CpaB [Planctomicrobium sp. SH661]|uniref:Flp pilus assembly protein CpaB n=1 Tax=Planctomicrobium sp. SH661 TaxID=3448124 RepID=UPI003F5BF284